MKRKSARELGLWLGELPPGLHNDVTDVPGVAVGHVSLIRGYGKLVPGQGPVRTGVTAILPHGGNLYRQPCRAGIEVFNGYGKSVGVPFIKETGVINSPVLLTNPLSVSDVANGTITYLLRLNPEIGNDARTPNILVFECDDSYLNDIRGRHVRPSDAILALQRASSGPVQQGNVGAGVGMSCFQLKGGIGSASRVVDAKRGYVLGILALANFGLLEDLLISGSPIGKSLQLEARGIVPGSLILIGMTNAPLSSPQLEKVARRAFLGMARTGGLSRTGSGEFCLMVSNCDLSKKERLSDWELDVYFQAAVEASAESIWNSLFLAETMEGRDGHIRLALPYQSIQESVVRSQ
ncbi:DmpA family aminopeptidase [Paradesulfitobacterium ferrireducens]|uniref:DmpA family aminopeptidase n=1 Tax=Paradesulfitobacterium ferrireducens TaxID=2816476 RepID=UPI001A8E2DF8|nr:P1 family peptidase [Paradesulfitobacterium ferrireducens]